MFSDNNKLIWTKGPKGNYVAKCNSSLIPLQFTVMKTKYSITIPKKIYDSLSKNDVSTEKTKLCSDGYCCLELVNSKANYINLSGKKTTFYDNEK